MLTAQASGLARFRTWEKPLDRGRRTALEAAVLGNLRVNSGRLSEILPGNAPEIKGGGVDDPLPSPNASHQNGSGRAYSTKFREKSIAAASPRPSSPLFLAPLGVRDHRNFTVLQFVIAVQCRQQSLGYSERRMLRLKRLDPVNYTDVQLRFLSQPVEGTEEHIVGSKLAAILLPVPGLIPRLAVMQSEISGTLFFPGFYKSLDERSEVGGSDYERIVGAACVKFRLRLPPLPFHALPVELGILKRRSVAFFTRHGPPSDKLQLLGGPQKFLHLRVQAE